MNKGFLKLSFLFGIVAVLALGVFAFANKPTVQPVEASITLPGATVEITEQTLSCGKQDVVISGTATYQSKALYPYRLKVKVDGNTVLNTTSEPSNWSTDPITLGEGTHTVQVIVEGAITGHNYATDKWEFTIDECPFTCPPGQHPEEVVNTDPVYTLINTNDVPQTPRVEYVCVDDPKEPEQPSNPPTFAGSSTEAPVCPDGNTVNVPANPHVLRAGEKATVNFFITEGDSADVVYKEVNASDWQHAVSNLKPNADRFVSVDITGLDPQLGYTFGVRQRIGCGGGQTITAVIVDGPEPQLFQFSYWEVK